MGKKKQTKWECFVEHVQGLIWAERSKAMAQDRLAYWTDSSAPQLRKWQKAIDRADWMIPRYYAALSILMNEPEERAQFYIDNPDQRAEILESALKQAFPEGIPAKEGFDFSEELASSLASSAKENPGMWN